MSKSEKTDTGPRAPSPKWLEGSHHSNAPKAKAHENRLAKRLGGKRYNGSGNRIWKKAETRSARTGEKPSAALWTRAKPKERKTDNGDLATPKFHFEHKFTRDASMSVKREWLDKVREGAEQHMKTPGLIITFDNTAPGSEHEEWAMVPLDVLERLIRKAEAA